MLMGDEEIRQVERVLLGERVRFECNELILNWRFPLGEQGCPTLSLSPSFPICVNRENE